MDELERDDLEALADDCRRRALGTEDPDEERRELRLLFVILQRIKGVATSEQP